MAKPNRLLEEAVDAEQRFEFDRLIGRAKQANALLKAELSEAMKLIERLESDRQTLLGLSDRKNVQAWSKPVKVDRGEAAALLLLSDLHIEERVDPDKVSGLNEYTPDIAKKRLRRVLERFVFLVDQQHRRTSNVDACVVQIGGDVISGYIHDELAESNFLSPIEACLVAEEMLEESLRYVLKHGRFKKVVVVCNHGNHCRTTPKPRVGSRYENSYSTLLYQHLRRRLADQPIDWLIAVGEYAYLDVLGHTVRFTHGDSVKYQGGLAGLSAPLNRSVMRWNKGRHADLTCLGHFHVWEWNRPNGWIVNGSLIGDTPYGLRFGHAEPCQSAVLITRKHGVVSAVPIFAS